MTQAHTPDTQHPSASTSATPTPSSHNPLTEFDGHIKFITGLPYGLQHVLAMFVANLAPIFLVASAAHMNASQSAQLVQSALLMAGLGTLLQLYPIWRFGSRLPIVTGISFTYVAAVTAIVATHGYETAVGAILVGGILEALLGLTAKWWHRFIPPIVPALVVTSIGLSLLPVAAQSFGGGAGARDFGSWKNILLASFTLIVCIAVQVFARGFAKQLSVLAGLVAGYILALCLHAVDFSAFRTLTVFSVPKFLPFTPRFDSGAIISLCVLYLVSAIEVTGDTTVLARVGLGRDPTDREISGSIAGDGLISFVSGLFGCLPLTSFAQNIGLVRMTKVVNRRVIASGGGILILSAFVPAIAAAFDSIPQAVMGGCTVVMFGSVLLAGFQMIARAGFSERNILIASLSLTMGVGFTQAPALFAHAPALVRQVFAGNPVAGVFIIALVLSLILPRSEKFYSSQSK
jgi:NCS2 family nucleobase:cation symporter-2